MESGPATEYHGEFLSFLEMQCPIPESNVMKGTGIYALVKCSDLVKCLICRLFLFNLKNS